MANWFYYDETGTKQGPITNTQLKELADSQKISPDTNLEADSGHKGKAGQVKGLFPAPEPNSNPFETPVSSQPSPASASAEAYCTNCGNPVSAQAVACMKCGADPRKHRKFCRVCGSPLNPEQVVCIKCGAGIKPNSEQKGDAFDLSEKNRFLAAFLALLLGTFGVHWFYLGNTKRGITYVVITALSILVEILAGLFTMFPEKLDIILRMAAAVGSSFGVLLVLILSLVDCVKMLCMKNDQFKDKYLSKN